jgi:xylulokinase
VMPEVAAVLGIPCVPVAGGGGDNAASAVGLGLVRPGEAFLSLGTSGVLFVVTDRFRPNPIRAAHAFCHAVPDRWHQMSVMLSASSALDWATAITGHGDLAAAVAAAEKRGIGGDTPIFLPYLSGERTPHNDAYARGVYLRLGNDTTAADLVAATMEGVAHAFAQGLDALTEAGSAIGDISVVGGGSRIDWWLTLLASALDRPLIKRAGGEIGAALGAARLGRLAAEGEAVDQLCLVPPVERIVAPDPALSARLQQRRPIFDDSYRRLRPVFREFPA